MPQQSPTQGGQVQIDPNSIQPLAAQPQQQGATQGVQIDPNSIKPLAPQKPSPGSTPDNNGGHPTSGWGSLLGHTIHIDPNDNPVVNGIKRVAAVGAGAGDALMDTLNGTVDLANKVDKRVLGHTVIPQGVTDTLHSRHTDLQQDNAENPTLNKVGYGAETLTEFLAGDEALKGLGLADRLMHTAKVAKVLEKSPRLMKALKIGADAMRAGTVQGGQTFARTGGNAHQALTDAATVAGTSGVLGTATGAVSGLLGKGARAARTVQDMGKVAESAPSSVDVSNQLGSAVNDAFAGEREAANQQLTSSTGTITDLASTAPEGSEITSSAQSMARDAQKQMHDRYAQGVRELSDVTDGQTIPYAGSPLHNAAMSIAEKGASDGKSLDSAFSQTRPGSPAANRMVDLLSDAGKDGKDPIHLDTDELIQRRQQLGERMRSLGWATGEDRADRAVYGRLIQGVDDTIAKLADQTGSPEASSKLASMNAEYRLNSKLFANRDVQSLLKGNVNDVSSRLMRGETSLDDINAVRKTLGDDNFAQLGSDSLKRMAADSVDRDGNLDLDGLVKRWAKIKPEVRTAMFGNTSADTFSDALGKATGATGKLSDVNDTVAQLLGNGKMDTLLKSPERVSALSQALGPDGMKSLGQSMLQSKIGEASTRLDPKTGEMVKTAFDPDKVLAWYKSFANAPEVRDAVFGVDDASKAAYNGLMSKLSEASSVKKLVKYGLLPVTFGGLGSIGGGVVPALVATLAGLGSEGFGSVRSILDSIANHPATWTTLRRAGDMANSPAASMAGKATRYATGQAAIYSQLRDAMSGQQPDDQVEPQQYEQQ